MKKLISFILALSLLSVFSISCSRGAFSFYDLGGTWKNRGGDTFSINTSAKTITKGNTTYRLNGEPSESKAELLHLMLLDSNGNNKGDSITFTSKTEAKGEGEFSGSWTKQ